MKKIRLPKLHLACSDDSLRPVMNHILVTKDEIVASNSYILATLKTLTRGPIEVGDIIDRGKAKFELECVEVLKTEPSKSTWKDGIITYAKYVSIIPEYLKHLI